MKITFLDGSAKEYPKAVSPLEIAEEISASLAKNLYTRKSTEWIMIFRD